MAAYPSIPTDRYYLLLALTQMRCIIELENNPEFIAAEQTDTPWPKPMEMWLDGISKETIAILGYGKDSTVTFFTQNTGAFESLDIHTFLATYSRFGSEQLAQMRAAFTGSKAI